MELIVHKEELAKALIYTQNIAERKSTMPILGNVLISAKDGKLQLAASDLEITATSTVGANIIKEGQTTVASKVFADVVRELPDGEVLVKLEEGERVQFHSQVTDSTLRILGQSAEEYPSLPGFSNPPTSEIDTKTLLEMVNKTLYAVSQDETRFHLNGVCVSTEEEDGKTLLQMVATDGHRLAKIVRPVDSFQVEGSIIVPRKGLLELKKILENEKQEKTQVALTEGFLLVEGPTAKLSVRLVDAEFPDYQQVFPKDDGQTLRISKATLEQALKRVALMVSDKNKSVKVDVIKNILQISSNSPELGDALEQINVEVSGNAEDLTAGFNARYMIDFTSTLSENQDVAFELHGSEGPAKLYAEGDESYVSVIMPMRLT